METIHLHDLVALTEALPDNKPRRGAVGVVIDSGPNGHYMVEFSDENGIPYATPTVSTDHLLKVYLPPDLVR